MKKSNWFPAPNELVKFRGQLFNIISVDMGGKCKIKQSKTRKVLSNIDISELEMVN